MGQSLTHFKLMKITSGKYITDLHHDMAVYNANNLTK